MAHFLLRKLASGKKVFPLFAINDATINETPSFSCTG